MEQTPSRESNNYRIKEFHGFNGTRKVITASEDEFSLDPYTFFL
jgi:hypothetical protein